MTQPKYSPEEALKRIKLMMEYDSSKTLTENEEIISEQYGGAAAAGTAAGAGVGALIGSSLPTTSLVIPGLAGAGATGSMTAGASAIASSMGTALGASGPAAMVLGSTVLGAAAGLALIPLAYWLITRDTGSKKVKKMFEMCSSHASQIAKLPRKLQDTQLRSLTDDIEDAIINDSYGFQGGTDEEKLFGVFKQFDQATASDFCAFVSYYNSHSESGDLFDDLDSDIDAESEWNQIFRPIRNCVEDSLLSLSNTDNNGGKSGGNSGGNSGGKVSGYKPCTGTYSFGCKSETIAKVQRCLKLVDDGKFGPKTRAALAQKGYSTFVDSDVDKICNTPPPKPNAASDDEEMSDVNSENY